MKPEILEMHKRLQPLYREKMGEWELGDLYYDITKKTVCVVTFQDKLKIYRQNDLFLPLPIDPHNPERGLLGMLKSNWTLSGPRYNDPVITSYGLCLIDSEGLEVVGYSEGETPEEAILKALCQKEGMDS